MSKRLRDAKFMTAVLITAAMGLFLLFPPVWAQSPAQEDVFRFPLGGETMEAFNETCAALAGHPLVKGNFEQEKILGRLNRSLKSSGNFIIAEGQGMVWETLQPFPSTLVLGKDYFAQSRRPGGEANVISAAGNETFVHFAEIISAVFSGNSQGLLGNFEVFYSGSPSGWELGLLPKDKTFAAFAQKITMKGDAAVKSILINEQNGDSTRYIMSNQSYPPELSTQEKAFFQVP